MLQAADYIIKLYNDVFLKYDATMLEINPMSEDNQGDGESNFLSWFQSTTEPPKVELTGDMMVVWTEAAVTD